MMTESTNYMLNSLKVDLGITTTAYDDRLIEYLNSATKYIETEGISLQDTIDDNNLVIMYASWLWQKRKENIGMPKMLRWALNNRLFAEKTNG